MIRTGILGGTFNPIHNAHLAMGRAALGQAALEEVWFMPSGRPPHKEGDRIVSRQDRENMIRLGIGEYPQFVFSDFEFCRPGMTYTAQTLSLLCREYTEREFYFILGGDSLMQLETWYQPERIMEQVNLLAFPRDEADCRAMQAKKAYLERTYGARIRLLQMEPMAVSSTQIRQRLARQENVCQWIPQKVWEYIQEHHLYSYGKD